MNDSKKACRFGAWLKPPSSQPPDKVSWPYRFYMDGVDSVTVDGKSGFEPFGDHAKLAHLSLNSSLEKIHH